VACNGVEVEEEEVAIVEGGEEEIGEERKRDR